MQQEKFDSLIIRPLNSIGPVFLNRTRQETIKSIGLPNVVQENGEFYDINGYSFKLAYKNDKVIFVEFNREANISIYFETLNVFNTPADELISAIVSKTKFDFDKNNPEIPYSYTFPNLELAFWRPTVPEDYDSDDPDDEYQNGKYFQTVAIAVKGYFSEVSM